MGQHIDRCITSMDSHGHFLHRPEFTVSTKLVSGQPLASNPRRLKYVGVDLRLVNLPPQFLLTALVTVYLLIYRTAKNNYFGNCPGIIGTDFYRACEVSGIIRTSKQLHAS